MRAILFSLFLFTVTLFSSAAFSFGLLEPKNEKLCLEKYLPLAKTEAVSGYYTSACYSLYKKSPKIKTMKRDILCRCNVIMGTVECSSKKWHKLNEDFLRKEICYDHGNGEDKKIREAFILEYLWQIKYKKYMSKEEYKKYLSQKDDTPILEWRAERKRAQCILKNKQLRNAQSETAAKRLMVVSVDPKCRE